MARVAITVQSPKSYPALPVAADSLDVAFTAADVANGNQIVMNGPFILHVRNTAGVAGTFTVSSVAHKGRTGDISAYSVGAGEQAAIRFDSSEGWKQTDGYLYFNGSAATIMFAAVQI